MRHPFHDVVVVGVHDTVQARRLDGRTSRSLRLEAARGALADAGLAPADVDGVLSGGADLAYDLSVGPVWHGANRPGIAGILEAAAAIATGQCSTVLLAIGQSEAYVDRSVMPPWTRPEGEHVLPWGLFTAAEFALVARRHMDRYGTTPEQLATVAATIRNNGHVNPDAVYTGRGPFTAGDVLASPMIAYPFHLLDCAMAAEGGTAMVLTTAERARDLPHTPIHLLGGAIEAFGPPYEHPPAFDLAGRTPGLVNGWVGRQAAGTALAMAGCAPADVDVAELYDPFSFEVLRQFEAFGFCGEGEGGAYVLESPVPYTTDGGTMSYSHPGTGQYLQRVNRGVAQLRGTCRSRQVAGAEVALCSNGGAGALAAGVLVLGTAVP